MNNEELRDLKTVSYRKNHKFACQKAFYHILGLEFRWEALKKKAIDYRFNKNGSHEDGRYCVAISVTDLLKWMEELEGEDGKEN